MIYLINIKTNSFLQDIAIITFTIESSFNIWTISIDTWVSNETLEDWSLKIMKFLNQYYLIKVEACFSIKCVSRLTEALISSIRVNTLTMTTGSTGALVDVFTSVSSLRYCEPLMTVAVIWSLSVDTVSWPTNIVQNTFINVKAAPVVWGKSKSYLTSTFHANILKLIKKIDKIK